MNIKSSPNKDNSLEVADNDRPGVDIVCVFDVSGSMSGNKI